MRPAAIAVFAVVGFLIIGSVRAQTLQTPPPSPPPAENLAAARELVQASNATDQFKALLPIILQNLKKTVVQNRPEVEKQYDAMVPMLNQKAQQRLSELAETMAAIFANNFTVAELHDITAFYRSPTGQKFIQRQSSIAQQSMAAGQQFGRQIANDVQQQMSGQAN